MSAARKDYSILQEKFGLQIFSNRATKIYPDLYPDDMNWVDADVLLTVVHLLDQAYSESEMSKAVEALHEKLQATSTTEEASKCAENLKILQQAKLIIKEFVWKKTMDAKNLQLMNHIRGDKI